MSPNLFILTSIILILGGHIFKIILHGLTNTIFIKTLFLELFYVHGKVEGTVERFPIYRHSHMHSLPCVSTLPHPSGTFVITDEPMITYRYHPVYSLHYGSCSIRHSVGLDKPIMACIHRYGIKQSIFTAIKVLCVLPIQTSPTPNPWQTLIFVFCP